MRIYLRSRRLILVYLAFQLLGHTALATPLAQNLGELLGYPGNEIVITNITDEERQLWSNPTAHERRQGIPMPDPKTLIAAYKVNGRTASTFYPMLIWIGATGTFLNSSTQQTLDLITSGEAKPVNQGGRGQFGSQSFEEIGKGGIYLGKIKLPSRNREMSEPQEKMALISILHQPTRNLDYRIALMPNLEGSVDLIPMPGGERYFETFNQLNDDESEPRYDVAKLFLNLNQLVDTEYSLTEQSPAPPPIQKDRQANLTNIPTNGTIQNNQPSNQVSQNIELPRENISWRWLVGFFISITLTGFTVKRYYSKRVGSR